MWWSVGTFRPTLQQQSCGWRYYQPKLPHPVIRPVNSLYNRVVSLGITLLDAVHEHPKNCNLFCTQAYFFGPIYTGTCNNLTPDREFDRKPCNYFSRSFLGRNFSISSEVASRLLAEGLHWGRGFPIYWVLPRVSTSFSTREDECTPYSKHNDPFYYFCTRKSKHTCLGDLTLFSAAPLY